MNLKSFFELENVIFSKEELEAPYENKSKAPYEEKPPQKKKKRKTLNSKKLDKAIKKYNS